MKRKDLFVVLVVVLISGVISLVIAKAIFVKPQSRQQQAEIVQPITANFPEPDKKYFNEHSINPTKLITINPNANADPFSVSPTQ